MTFPTYTVVSFTLNHQAQPLQSYRHGADFIEGDKRIIRYDGESEDIRQTFYGYTQSGGWYDED